MRRFILAGLLALAACTAPQDTGDPAADAYANAVRDIGLACDGYSGALEQLAIMRDLGQLSDEARDAVTAIRGQVGPICEADAPALTLADGRSTLEFVKTMTARLLIYQGDAT